MDTKWRDQVLELVYKALDNATDIDETSPEEAIEILEEVVSDIESRIGALRHD